MSGKIGTLFEDSAKTTPLYPRTKLSAVSDQYGNSLENNVVYFTNTGPEASAGLDASSVQGNDVADLKEIIFAGVDPNNVLAENISLNPSNSYTATQDCLMFIYNYAGQVRVNGVRMCTNQDGGAGFIPLKKGQTAQTTDSGSSNGNVKVFGIKQG